MGEGNAHTLRNVNSCLAGVGNILQDMEVWIRKGALPFMHVEMALEWTGKTQVL